MGGSKVRKFIKKTSPAYMMFGKSGSGKRGRRRNEQRVRRRQQLTIQQQHMADIAAAQRGELSASSQVRVDRATALARTAGERARRRTQDQMVRSNVGGGFASSLLGQQQASIEQQIAGIEPAEIARVVSQAGGIAAQPVQEIGSGKGASSKAYARMGGQLLATAVGAAAGGPAGGKVGGQVGGNLGDLFAGGGSGGSGGGSLFSGSQISGGSVPDLGYAGSGGSGFPGYGYQAPAWQGPPLSGMGATPGLY
jgi:hypothetical protein